MIGLADITDSTIAPLLAPGMYERRVEVNESKRESERDPDRSLVLFIAKTVQINHQIKPQV